jgi:hypothetical protein
MVSPFAKRGLGLVGARANLDWETGGWINKGFIYDFEKEWLVKTSRKRKNK